MSGFIFKCPLCTERGKVPLESNAEILPWVVYAIMNEESSPILTR
jgi:hypothetical protein